jgi:hypothetical protein
MSARLLVVGLGNLTHPLTRHRPVLFLNTLDFVLFIFSYSVGQLALDSLSTRLGVTLSLDKLKGGYFAETKIDINGRLLDIALYKTRTFFCIVI